MGASGSYLPPLRLAHKLSQGVIRLKKILIALFIGLLLLLFLVWRSARAVTPYKVICHHNPGNAVTLSFMNLQSYLGHLGTPHNRMVFDTNGPCVTPTATPTPSPTPKPSKDKYVNIVEACDNTADVEIYGGDTRRTWRVNDEEKWVEKYTTVTWEDVTIPVTVEWWHENSDAWKPADDEYTKTYPAENCAVPTPEQPRGTTEAGTPQCTDHKPLILPSNVHVIRNGSDATVNFFTQSSNANIYYRTSGQPVWQHALRDIPVTNNYVSVTIHDLIPTGDYDFGVQSANSCAGGEVVIAVVEDSWQPQTFMFSWYEWL